MQPGAGRRWSLGGASGRLTHSRIQPHSPPTPAATRQQCLAQRRRDERTAFPAPAWRPCSMQHSSAHSTHKEAEEEVRPDGDEGEGQAPPPIRVDGDDHQRRVQNVVEQRHDRCRRGCVGGVVWVCVCGRGEEGWTGRDRTGGEQRRECRKKQDGETSEWRELNDAAQQCTQIEHGPRSGEPPPVVARHRHARPALPRGHQTEPGQPASQRCEPVSLTRPREDRHLRAGVDVEGCLPRARRQQPAVHHYRVHGTEAQARCRGRRGGAK